MDAASSGLNLSRFETHLFDEAARAYAEVKVTEEDNPKAVCRRKLVGIRAAIRFEEHSQSGLNS